MEREQYRPVVPSALQLFSGAGVVSSQRLGVVVLIVGGVGGPGFFHVSAFSWSRVTFKLAKAPLPQEVDVGNQPVVS